MGDYGNMDSVAVIGLGRFGASLALELERNGTEVLGIDNDAAVVTALTGDLTQVVHADGADEETARELGLQAFDRIVVAIGGRIDVNCLAASLALQLGAEVWAKAMGEPHARILSKLGVQHIVLPEFEMGRRVANLVRGRMLDYIEMDEGYALVKTTPTPEVVGMPLGESGIRSRYGVTVVAVKRQGGGFDYAAAETVIEEGDVVIVSGRTRDVESFSARA